jgi:hypothetical protein
LKAIKRAQTMNTKTESNNGKSSDSISLNPLSFEEALENLLKVQPIENKSLIPKKKKSKPKTKK